MNFKHQKHLINILKNTKDHHPNFTVFLGAGASVTSGVKTAGELISSWREVYVDMYNEDKLESQSWFDKPNEYSELFEALYDQPSQRREFIESCINDARPSWGYIYLVNLIIKKHFNTIFTTNFDDLLNEACYTFSDKLRPIVSAHDSSIRSIRLTSTRPKIIKLHGDFLFDNIKNTSRELESLENNMRAKFRQYASEFGMIFVGYAGNDRSIMDTLNTLLHSELNFPHGIYWCVRKGTQFDGLSEELKNLSRFPRFHLVEIDGFDELFAEIHNGLSCKLQQQVANPYNALSEKLDSIFINDVNVSVPDNPIIESDFNELSGHVSKIKSTIKLTQKIETLKSGLTSEQQEEFGDTLEQLIDAAELVKHPDSVHIMSIPNVILAQSSFSREKYEESLDYSKSALNTKVSSVPMCLALNSMSKLNNFEEFDLVLSYFDQLNDLTENSFHALNSTAVDLISENHLEEANSVLLEIKKHVSQTNKDYSFVILNMGLIKKLSDSDLSEELQKELEDALEKASDQDDHWLSLGLSIVLGLEEVSGSILGMMDLTDLEQFYVSDFPIKKLISDALHAKLDTLMEENNLVEDEDELADNTVVELNNSPKTISN